MWIPKWVVYSWPVLLYAAWLLKICLFDFPAEKRKKIADAKREKEELAPYWANVRKADLMLEDAVEKGAPVCLLWDRNSSERNIIAPNKPSQSLIFTYETYRTYYEARKLQE